MNPIQLMTKEHYDSLIELYNDMKTKSPNQTPPHLDTLTQLYVAVLAGLGNGLSLEPTKPAKKHKDKVIKGKKEKK